MKTLADAEEYARRYHDGHLTIWGSPDYWRVAFGVQDCNVMDKKGPSEGVTLEEAIDEAIRDDENARRSKPASGLFVGPCPHCRKPVMV